MCTHFYLQYQSQELKDIMQAAVDSKLANRLIHERTKPTFKDAWQSHRCIIPASYYYEWEHFKSPDGKVKTGDKYVIQPKGSMVTWLCGLYRIEDTFPVFTVLTREPSDEISRIHDRMPLIMPEEKIDEWISPDSKPEDLLSYALTDMIMEKATENDEKDESKGFPFINS